MNANALVVFTYRHKGEIIEEGGSQAWALSPNTASRCTYLVCTRNRYHEGAGPEEHYSAFLVGKITTVEIAPESKSNQKGSSRYIVRFDEYALIDPPLPDVWKGERNPVRYINDIADFGINVSTLKWIRRSKEKESLESNLENANGATQPKPSRLDLLMAEAKSELATKLGISSDRIEITIRG